MSDFSQVDINSGIGPSTACEDYLIGNCRLNYRKSDNTILD